MSTANTSDWMRQEMPPAGLGRRLMALVYDSFLIAAIWLVTLMIWGHLVPAPAAGGEDPVLLRNLLTLILGAEVWGFYAWFWLHGGQTLGMRAWRLMSRDYRRRSMSLVQTLIRFLAGAMSWALLGAGYLLALLPPNQTLHDRLSATETVLVPKAG